MFLDLVWKIKFYGMFYLMLFGFWYNILIKMDDNNNRVCKMYK